MDETLRILLLEDVPSDAELVKIELRQAGFRFTMLRVETEPEFRRALADFQPDLILADYSLPSFNALKALHILQGTGRETPFILVTGSQPEETAAAVMKEGAQDYLLKTSLTRLPTAVRNALERKAAHQAKLQAEEILRESEERHRTLFNEALDGICLVDAETGLIIDCNQAMVALVGRERVELIGQPQRILHPIHNGQEVFSPTFRQHLTDQEGQLLETQIVTKTGMTRDVEIKANLLHLQDRKMLQGVFRDITERKRAEEELQTSQRRLEMALIGGGLGTYEHNLQTGEIQVDARYLTMFGYAPGELDLTNMKQWEQLVHPEDFAQTRSPHTEVEYRMRHKDGHWIWVLDTGRVVEHDSLGHPLRMSGVHQDITKRKRAEEALEESEEKYRVLVENATEVILVAQDGMLKFVNRTASELTGYSEQELTSRPFPEFVHPDDRGMVVERHQKRLKGDAFQPKYAFRLVTHDGSIRWIEIAAVLIDWEGKPATLNFLTDITERKRAEEALRREQMMLARTEGIAQIGSWAWDIATDTVIWSDELFRIFQRDPREGAPSFAEHPAFYHPDDMARLQQAVEVTVALGTPYELELRAIRKDGETRVCMARGVAEMAPGGHAVHLFGSLQDITESKRLEQSVEKARADFLFAVSHELKTPLHVMGAIQEMIESLPQEQRLAQFRDYNDVWRRNMMRLRFIIENLVDSQRPAGMGLKLDKRPANLMDLVREIAAELEPVASARSVQLCFQGGSLPPTSMDIDAVRRLVENLLTNAIKFSHLGGQVEIRWRIEGEMVCLDVCDFGMGIDPQIRPFLFQPFYRSPEALKAGVQGTGLGLYVSKMIAEAHGGTIQLESEPGKGTTVTVRLPTE